MNKIGLRIALLGLLAFLTAGRADAYTVNLIYYTSVGLMDEYMSWLNNGDIVHLIYSPDLHWDPPNIMNGMPTGNDVLWDVTYIGAGGGTDGKFLDLDQYSSAFTGGYVYIRFFNAGVMGQVTYYGVSPLHTLSDIFGFDIWDITAGGLYLWTEYPFVVIPEPETWLTLLPAIVLGIFIYKRSKKNKNPERSGS